MPNKPYPFRVKARLLRLLGDELIRDPGLAVFELVKNAYDADAKRCDVTLEDLEDMSKAQIIVQDNGCGMSVDIMRDVWLVIATDFRAEQRAERKRTELGRFPLGNKGLGRLAVHKLGQHITVITRVTNGAEVVVEMDCEQLDRVEDLANTAITIATREAEIFKGKTHGTRIEVRRLREAWDKAKTRTLQRAVTSLCSPFHGPDDFRVNLEIKPNDWLKGLLDPTECGKMLSITQKGKWPERN